VVTRQGVKEEEVVVGGDEARLMNEPEGPFVSSSRALSRLLGLPRGAGVGGVVSRYARKQKKTKKKTRT
jgi:hypothetical protein